MKLSETTILIKGGGDLGSGIAWKLHRAGLKVAVVDLPSPMAIRREVSFSTAINDGSVNVDGVKGKHIQRVPDFKHNFVPVFDTSQSKIIKNFQPDVLVDSTLKALDNRTTFKDDAPFTVGVGPGFTAPDDIDCVIESNRGHYVGRTIWNGKAQKYTGVPGNIEGYTSQRLLRAPDSGKFRPLKKIGDSVQKDELIGWVNRSELRAGINGIIRGLIAEETHVKRNHKIGDIDPRGIKKNVFTVSDKARNIGGGVLEAVLAWVTGKYKDLD
ncbi:MAG: selenium-dependent molybdenum cofactor biosynthesis protein YqeB [Elusimicrobiota bacterium]